MKPKVYLETTVISYLTALPSRDLVAAAHQQLTRDWWDRRDRFELFVSRAVLVEAAAGDDDAAARRLTVLEGIPVLETGEGIAELASGFIGAAAIPAKAVVDAVHIAVAAANGMDYLLTWNCAHIANAVIRPRIEAACLAAGLEPPIICTPEELMEE